MRGGAEKRASTWTNEGPAATDAFFLAGATEAGAEQNDSCSKSYALRVFQRGEGARELQLRLDWAN